MAITPIRCVGCGILNVPTVTACVGCGAPIIKSMPPAAPTHTPPAPPAQRVVVTDFDMPIGSMIVFMIKWAIASIPALFILGFVAFLLMALLAGFGAASRLP